MTIDIRGALYRARLLFKEENIESGYLDAEVLLAHVLGVEKHVIHRDPGYFLTPGQHSRFRELVARRLKGEPVAYLVGRREFMGLEFKVDRRVLVPRPETELLVETALALLGGPRPPEGPPVLLPPAPETGIAADVGTGSGAIALSLAYYSPEVKVYATDISPAALEVARENAVNLGVTGRVTLLRGNLLDPLEKLGIKGKLCLVTANLPYITSADMDGLPRDVKDYEPRRALDGGPDGLDLYRQLIPAAGEYLAPGGYLLMEIGPGQGESLLALAPQGFAGRVVNDPAGRERLVIFRSNT